MANIISGIVEGVGNIIEKPIEAKANVEIAEIDADKDVAIAESQTNTAEATKESLFVCGWRPFIGWTCGGAFAYHFILQPLLLFILTAYGHKVDLPSFNMDSLTTVLFGMLGLGGLRTFEKIKR